MKKKFTKKIIATLIFSLIAAIVLIVHGVFFDLDFEQIKRITIGGFVVTFVLVFVGLLVLEWIFTVEEDEEIVRLKRRVKKLEKKKLMKT